MKKWNLKQFVNENLSELKFVIYIFIWLVLLSCVFQALFTNTTVCIKLSIIFFFVLYTIWMIKTLKTEHTKTKKQYEEYKNQELQVLENKYKDYIDLVDKHVKLSLNNLDSTEFYSVNYANHDYLFYFKNSLEWVCKNRIAEGKPDSFIVATCLLFSLIKLPIIAAKRNSIEKIHATLFKLNLYIAMNCVFEIISEPTTYYKDTDGNWIEEKHPKVDIVVPDGVIRNTPLYNRILNAIYKDYESDKLTSIMQFANMLHLLYLNCCK